MKRTILAGLVALAVFGIITKAVADGIPTVQPLTYTGVLQNSNGTPVTSAQSMQLTLWDDAMANASANQKCVTPTQSVTPDAQGRFQVQLDQACFDAVKSNPDLWIQLQIGAAVLPRTKINAVPYAVESGRSSRQIIAYGGKRRTVFGQYCGATAAVNGAVSANAGAVTGFPATKILCEQACSSPTAHICSGVEVTASYELGLNPPIGWVGTGTYSVQGTATLDCRGFRSSSNGDSAHVWGNISDGYVDVGACGQVRALLCCD